MRKRSLLILLLSCCLTSLLMTQQTLTRINYPTDDPDRIAVIYFHCSDTQKDKLFSKQEMEDYFFGSNNPNKEFFQMNLNGQYNYTGEVFAPIKIPFTEEEFSAVKVRYAIQRLRDLQKEEEDRLEKEIDRLEKERNRLETDEFNYLIMHSR